MELVSDGTAEQRWNFPLNPGIEYTFPWLTNIANNFETYQFLSLKMSYVPAVPTSSPGRLSICPDYDAADDNTYLSRIQFMSFEDSASGSIWDGVTMVATPTNMRKRKTYYTRSTTLTANKDIKTYDTGTVTVIASGVTIPSGQSYGDLWITYSVHFQTPQLSLDDDNQSLQVLSSLAGNPFTGTTQRLAESDNLTVASGSTVKINPGKYILDYAASFGSTVTGVSAPTFAGPGYITPINTAVDTVNKIASATYFMSCGESDVCTFLGGNGTGAINGRSIIESLPTDFYLVT